MLATNEGLISFLTHSLQRKLGGSEASGKMMISVLLFAVLGWLLAKVGPTTFLNGSGSKNGAENTQT